MIAGTAIRGDLDLLETARWSARMADDRERARRNQTEELRSITNEVEKRSRAAGACALILSGSTARGRRTHVSDLDYHVVGPRPEVRDLRADVDLYADEPDAFMRKLRDGDDFVHWSIRFGCVIFDRGVVRDAAACLVANDLWPDPARKLRQARNAVRFARSMIESGDREASQEEVRTALSVTSRWWLLSRNLFPLARDELDEQLAAAGASQLGGALRGSIHGSPSETELAAWLNLAEDALAPAPAREGRGISTT